jgi:succinate-semialdehyde dehydrogenase / glutarate-semialdehyde dehydrogenase
MQSINPATGELIAEYAEHTAAEVEAILDRAARAFAGWRRTPVAERAQALSRVAALLRRDRDATAALMTAEMGKPINQALAEVDKCAWVCDYYAEQAEAMLAPVPARTDAVDSYVQFLPMGPVLAVMPWNFPYWQVFRAGAAILAAGNPILLKHAENVTGCALALERLFAEAGLPEHVVQAVLLTGPHTTPLMSDRRLAAATLTGSDRAGAAVAAAAIKKVVLELGGSDPFIVLEDADVPAAAQWAVKARFQNTGQSCIAAKRLIVVEPVADEFEAELVQRVQALEVGDPTKDSTDLGPMARADLRDALTSQVRRTVSAGADVLVGWDPRSGKRPGAEPGFYFTPTVVRLSRKNTETAMMREETFGPAAALVRVPGEDAAIALANESPYGLSSNLWTRDLDRARRLSAEIQAGACFVNGMTASDPRLPFGGTKRSGYGRELAEFGIREFVNAQAVYLAR